MQSYFESLKLSMERVRSKNLETADQSEENSEIKQRHKQAEERQSDDLVKLDSLIKQLTERWHSALTLYKTRYNHLKFRILLRLLSLTLMEIRKSNLKECQKLYNKYQSELAKEKHTLNSIVIETDGGNGNDTLKSVNSKPQKRSPGTVI